MEWLPDGRVRAKKSAAQKKKDEEDGRTALAGFLIVVALIWFFVFRGGDDDIADAGAVVPPTGGTETAELLDEELGTEERVRNESVDVPVDVLNFFAASSEVLEVLFVVRNSEAVPMNTVACSVSAFVSTQQVARLFGSGGTIRNLEPGEVRRVTTSARIRGDQAQAVTRAMVTCTALLPENRPIVVDQSKILLRQTEFDGVWPFGVAEVTLECLRGEVLVAVIGDRKSVV
jgi:hypothetical protein